MSYLIKTIEKIVCKGEDIPSEILHTETREGRVKETRQIIMYLAMQLGVTEAQASGYFGLKHSNANHVKKLFKGYLDNRDKGKYKAFAARIDDYTEKVWLTRRRGISYPDMIEIVEDDIRRIQEQISMLKEFARELRFKDPQNN